MAKDGLTQYRGELTPAQIAAGMNAAIRNANRLVQDARLLLENGRHPSAASLAILSIEESGKVSVLRGLAMAPNETVRRQYWRDYRTHRSKNPAWILPDLIAKGARCLDALRPATDAQGEHAAILDSLKQIGFYTDCLGKAHWSEPETVIDGEFAASLVKIADVFANKRTVSVEELELWITHMRPVYGAPLEWMKTALLRWNSVMTERGLAHEGTIPFEAFVRGKPMNDGSGDKE